MERIAKKIGEKTVEAEITSLIQEFLPINIEIEISVVTRKEKGDDRKWLAIMMRPRKNK